MFSDSGLNGTTLSALKLLFFLTLITYSIKLSANDVADANNLSGLLNCNQDVSSSSLMSAKAQSEANTFRVPTNGNDTLIGAFEDKIHGWHAIGAQSQSQNLKLSPKSVSFELVQSNYAPQAEHFISAYSYNCGTYLYREVTNLNPGSKYVISFEYRSTTGSVRSVEIIDENFDAIKKFEVVTESADWQWGEFRFLASTASTSIVFHVPADGGLYELDNIRIRASKPIKQAIEHYGLDVFDIEFDEGEMARLTRDVGKFGLHIYPHADEIGSINGNFKFDNILSDIELSVPGGTPGNWGFRRKSLKIKFLSGDLRGFKRMRLQRYDTRQGPWELIINKVGSQLDLTTVATKPVWLRVNGRDWGLYLMIHPWRSETLEVEGAVAGDIFTGVNEYLIDHSATKVTDYRKYQQVNGNFKNDYTQLKMLEETIFNDDHSADVWSILDKKSWISWIILQRLVNSVHSDTHHNNRFFFDNTKGRYVVIPWDIFGPYTISALRSSPLENEYIDRKYNIFVDRILQDPENMHLRNSEMWKYVTDERKIEELKQFVDASFALFSDLTLDEESDKTKLPRFAQQKGTLLANLERIKWTLNSDNDVFLQTTLANGFKDWESNQLVGEIDISTRSFSSIGLTSIELRLQDKPKDIASVAASLALVEDTNDNGMLDLGDKQVASLKYKKGRTLRSTSFETILHSKRKWPDHKYGAYFSYIKVLPNTKKFFLINRSLIALPAFERLRATVRNASSGRKLKPRYYVVDAKAVDAFKNLNKIAFSEISTDRVDTASKNIFVFQSGTHDLFEDQIFGPGVTVVFEAGATLNLGPNVSLVIQGNAIAAGTEKAPVTVQRLDEGVPWGTVLLDGSNGDFYGQFSHLVMNGGVGANIRGLLAHGMLSVYSANVRLNDSVFVNANGEDAVNIKNGMAVIERSEFRNSHLDALDLDFVEKGSVVLESYFDQNKGDAIDISGSHVLIQRNKIFYSSDKGISAGEASTALLFDNLIANNTIGIAAKEGADILGTHNTVSDNAVGVAGYRKKRIFKDPSVKISNFMFLRNGIDVALAQDTFAESDPEQIDVVVTNSIFRQQKTGMLYNMYGLKREVKKMGKKGHFKAMLTEDNSNSEKALKGDIILEPFNFKEPSIIVPDPKQIGPDMKQVSVYHQYSAEVSDVLNSAEWNDTRVNINRALISGVYGILSEM